MPEPAGKLVNRPAPAPASNRTQAPAPTVAQTSTSTTFSGQARPPSDTGLALRLSPAAETRNNPSTLNGSPAAPSKAPILQPKSVIDMKAPPSTRKAALPGGDKALHALAPKPGQAPASKTSEAGKAPPRPPTPTTLTAAASKPAASRPDSAAANKTIADSPGAPANNAVRRLPETPAVPIAPTARGAAAQTQSGPRAGETSPSGTTSDPISATPASAASSTARSAGTSTAAAPAAGSAAPREEARSGQIAAPSHGSGGPQPAQASPLAAGAAVMPRDNSAENLARLRNAAPSPIQTQALSEAALVNADGIASEMRVMQMGVQKRASINALLNSARQIAGSFVGSGIASIQAFLMAQRAELVASVGAVLANVSSTVVSGLQSAQTHVANARTRMQQGLNGVATSLQNRVSGVTNRITGFIDSIPIPDLPGIGALRSGATRMLNGASGLINRAVGRTASVVGDVAGAGLQAVEALLQGATVTISALLALATAVITNALQTITMMLIQIAVGIAGVLGRVLTGVVLPVLGQLAAVLIAYVSAAQQRTLAVLRENRRRALQALADAVAPAETGTASAGGEARQNEEGSDDAQRRAFMNRVVTQAATINRAIVQAFDMLTGGILANIGRLLLAAVMRVASGVGAFLMRAMHAISSAIQQGIRILWQMAQAAAASVLDTLQSLASGALSLAESITGFISGGIGQVADYAERAFNSITGFVSRLFATFIRTLTGNAPEAESVVGDFALHNLPTPSPGGPITKPPPLPDFLMRIYRIIAPLATVVVYVVVLVLFGKDVADLVVQNPLLVLVLFVVIMVAIAIAVALAVLLLLLLVWLLILLVKWIVERLRRNRKRVVKVRPARTELGVGGRTLPVFATLNPGMPPDPSITWSVNPGGTPPTGVTAMGSDRNGKLSSIHPSHGTLLGGTTFTVRAALASNPSDFADYGPITLIQVTSALYAANPPLATITLPGNPTAGIPPMPVPAPENSGEPNRDGISGNTVDVDAMTHPAGRSLRLEFRRALGASRSGMTVTPASDTGEIGLRILDDATGATLDETVPSLLGPAALMADLPINAVPTGVSSLSTIAPVTPPYGVQNRFGFSSSDTLHPPLTRVAGELVTDGGDDFTIDPPNGGFNPGYRDTLAAPANQCGDTLGTPSNLPHSVDHLPAIDVNRFVGPGVPQLPRTLNYKQEFVYVFWQTGTVVSRAFTSGNQIRRLIGTPGNFQFTSDQVFGGVSAPQRAEPYVGNPLIDFSNMALRPDARGAHALAADNAATGAVGVSTTVAGRLVNWSIVTGDLTITSGNPSTPPATMHVRAGTQVGPATIRAEDFVYPNRQLDGNFNIAKVELTHMAASDPVVAPGTNSTTVMLDAEPGGRIVQWAVDATAAAAGVTLNRATTGPDMPPMGVTVIRPGGYSGTVTITATDSVLTSVSASVIVKFT